MSRINARSKWFLSLALLGAVSTGLAQDPTRASAITFEVRPGTNAQFEEFITAYIAAADSIDSPIYWLASQTEVGGSNNYIFHRQLGSWSDLENSPATVLGQAHNDREVERLSELYSSSVARTHSAGYLDRPDLSRNPPGGPVVAVNYLEIKVHANMNGQFEAFVKRLIEATDATAPGAYWIMRAPAFGASNTYRGVIVYPEWADIDAQQMPVPRRLTEHFGVAEGTRIMQMGNDAIANFETRLRRTRPDLSRQPAD